MLKRFPTVGVVVLKEGSVLLVIKDNHPKHACQLPGGQVEAGETSIDAACRELEETTGLKTGVNNLLKIPTEWEAIIKKDYGEAIFPFICFVCTKYSNDIRKTDTATPEWVSLKTLKDRLLNPNTQNAIDSAIKMLGVV